MTFSIEWTVAAAVTILSVITVTAVFLLARFCFNRGVRIPQNAIHAEAGAEVFGFDVDAGLACGLTSNLLRPCDITKVLEDHEGSDDDAADLPAIDELPGDPLL